MVVPYEHADKQHVSMDEYMGFMSTQTLHEDCSESVKQAFGIFDSYVAP